jgi:hypothetical protein
MDVQIVAIIVIFGLLFILEQFEQKSPLTVKENFAVIRKGYTNPSTLLEPGYSPLHYSVNYGQKHRDFGNFGTFGSYPPNPICPSCHLGRNCKTPPYLRSNEVGDESGDQHGNVCTSCSTLCGKNYADLGRPFLVAARSNGKPRVCRRLT